MEKIISRIKPILNVVVLSAGVVLSVQVHSKEIGPEASDLLRKLEELRNSKDRFSNRFSNALNMADRVIVQLENKCRVSRSFKFKGQKTYKIPENYYAEYWKKPPGGPLGQYLLSEGYYTNSGKATYRKDYSYDFIWIPAERYTPFPYNGEGRQILNRSSRTSGGIPAPAPYTQGGPTETIEGSRGRARYKVQNYEDGSLTQLNSRLGKEDYELESHTPPNQGIATEEMLIAQDDIATQEIEKCLLDNSDLLIVLNTAQIHAYSFLMSSFVEREMRRSQLEAYTQRAIWVDSKIPIIRTTISVDYTIDWTARFQHTGVQWGGSYLESTGVLTNAHTVSDFRSVSAVLNHLVGTRQKWLRVFTEGFGTLWYYSDLVDSIREQKDYGNTYLKGKYEGPVNPLNSVHGF